MKKLFRQFCIAAAALCVMGFAGCSDDDPEPHYDAPVIAVKNVTATSTSVTFTLEPVHAVRSTYAVAPKGASGTPVEVKGSAASTQTVTGLEADREYTITAVAYGEGDLRSEPATYDFVTNATAQVAIGKVTATYKSATFTLTPTNATAYAYRLTGDDHDNRSRAEGDWVRIEGTEPSEITLDDLAAERHYTIEAYASNAEGDGEIVSKAFVTEPLPAALTVTAAATSKAVWMKFEMCADVTSGYYYYLHDTSYSDDPVTSIETFLQDLRESPDWYTLMTASSEDLRTGCVSNMEYKLFTVATDLEGTIDESTVAELSVTTKQLDALRSSQAAVGIASLTPAYISLDAELEPTDDSVMALVECVKKSVVQSMGNITMYVNMNLGNFKPVLSSSLTKPYKVKDIEPETDYYLFTVGIDANGNYGQLDFEEFTTTAVDYREDVKVVIDVKEPGFLDVSLQVTYDNCQSVRYAHLTEKQFNDWYEADEAKVWPMLYSATAEQLSEGEVILEHLTYNTAYTIYALPVTSDGQFGTPAKVDFSTLKYAAAGTSSVMMALDEIDRTGNHPVARFTLTPDADCAKFIYQSLGSEIYANNSAKIGDYIFKLGNYKTVEPAEETQVEVTLWGTDYYLLAIACDAEGNWSSVQISEKLIYDPNGGEEPEPEPEGDPDEVAADQISATAATVSFISYLYDQSSWNADWSDWDNSVYRADVTLEPGYTAWYYFVDTNSYNWVAGHDVGEGKSYATLAQWIKSMGRQLTASGPIAARGEYNTDYLLLVLPETADGKHSSERVYKSEIYRWDSLTGDVTDPGITGGGDEGGGGIDPRMRRR